MRRHFFRINMRRSALLLLSVTILSSTVESQRARPAPGTSSDIDAYVARVLRTFMAPGMAVTVVRDGKVRIARGYGVQRVGDTASITPDTRFGLGENSRAFTATAITMLADRGTLPIDTPIVRYLPEFALSDPYVTANITARDLLVQRSGLGVNAGDLLWWPATTYSRTDVVRRLRHLPLRTGFRSRYAHENVLYIVAGTLIEAVTQKSWEQVISETLLKKLGMNNTSVRHSDATRVGNIAGPHTLIDGRPGLTLGIDADAANPNSGISSTASDMAKWMIAHLNNGRSIDSVQVWRGWSQLQLWTGVTPMPTMSEFDLDMMRQLEFPDAYFAIQPQFRSYAPGAEVRDYRGTRVIWQDGLIPGYASTVVYVPSLKLGISVLTNVDERDAAHAVTQRVLDEHLGVGSTDWASILDDMRKTLIAKTAELRKEMPESMLQLDSALRDTSSKPSLPIWKYAGRYEDAWYGTVTIDISEDYKLSLRMGATPGMIGDVVHWEKDVFMVRWRDRSLKADTFIWFDFNRRGEIEGARMESVDSDVRPSFDYADLRLIRRPF